MRFFEGRWQIVGRGQNTDWDAAVTKLNINFAPECTPAYLAKSDLGSWLILTDRNDGVIVYELSSTSTVARTKAELAEHLGMIASH